ncbi:MAG: hypothetical protein AB8B51_09615 [Sedimentitalea sp.]
MQDLAFAYVDVFHPQRNKRVGAQTSQKRQRKEGTVTLVFERSGRHRNQHLLGLGNGRIGLVLGWQSLRQDRLGQLEILWQILGQPPEPILLQQPVKEGCQMRGDVRDRGPRQPIGRVGLGAPFQVIPDLADMFDRNPGEVFSVGHGLKIADGRQMPVDSFGIILTRVALPFMQRAVVRKPQILGILLRADPNTTRNLGVSFAS